MNRYIKSQLFEKLKLFIIVVLLMVGVVHGAVAAPSQTPLFLKQTTTPMITLVLSKDHELYKKAYNDYSNLDGGTLTAADTTYRNSFEYYGYFDPNWCYSYSANATTPANSYFTPIIAATTHKCTAGSGYWSGNFLNWSTMTRIDVLRRVLYGGKRSVDDTTQTVLERSYLPRDIHAFVKVYSGTDMNELTPYAHDATTQPAISMCNVSTALAGYPVIRVANGAWRQWSASESRQCQYDGNNTTPNSSASLIEATVKVNSCVTGKDGDTSARCRQYGSSTLKKPFGLLQRHGEAGNIKFSLVTGSYLGNTKGGVLRREASLIAGNPVAANNEVNLTTGQFNTGVNGIIKNIDSFKTATYNFSNSYTDCSTHSITVDKVKAQDSDNRRCSDWGNPLAEIYLEALRYIAGNKTATTGFNVDDTGTTTYFPGVPGLTASPWGDTMADPWPATEWCAKCFTIVLSTGANSFDGDNLASVTDLPGLSTETALDTITNSIGTQEYSDFSSRQFFSGGVTNGDRYCKPTTLTGLSQFKGMCPEQPATEGSYQVAGLAYYAHVNDLRSNTTHKEVQSITSYAIDLAESLPSFEVPVGTPIEFLPACEAMPGGGSWQTCSLIDVKVESIIYSGTDLVGGSYLFYWEDSLWGNDYDFDGAQRITFCVGSHCNDPSTVADEGINSDQIKIVNSIPYANAGNNLRFSYNIVGVGTFVDTNVVTKQSTSPTYTANDLSSFPGGILTPWADRPGGSNFNTLKSSPDNIPDNVTRVESVFTASASNTAELLKKPLYYVAKYGGFDDVNGNDIPDNDNLATTNVNESEWDADGDSVPDNYFSVKNPALLESSMNGVFTSILGRIASASSAAVSSTRLSQGAFVYQARFNSTFWSGELVAYEYGANGVLGALPKFISTKVMTNNYTTDPTLNIWTSTSNTANVNAVAFNWANISAQQKADLASAPTTTLDATQTALGQARLDWITGLKTKEAAGSSPLLRSRTNVIEGVSIRNIIGDIVDSSPVYDGPQDMKYDNLPVGGSTYAAYLATKRLKAPKIFLGANDGMIHAFNANTLAYGFSYLPPSVYSHLDDLTKTDYGTAANGHKFLVNGQITVGDAYINNAWSTVLVASLGAGGKNVIGLDITNATSTVAPKLLFSFDTSNQPKIGHVMGKPFIAPMKNGRFAAVFANGYEGSALTTSLFVVDLEDPTSTTHSRVIDAVATSAVGNGLSTPAILPDIMGRAEYAYAGDLQGNMWRFDLTSATPASWSSMKIFTAKDNSNKVQPIYAAPTLGFNGVRGNKVMVYFGTGKYFEDTDTSLGTTVNSFYAVLDEQAIYARANLTQKVITEASGKRTLSADSVALWSTATIKGWYMDFPVGERVTIKPLLIFDRLIFPTLKPGTDPCGFGGTSWLMEAIAVGDKADTTPMLGDILQNDFLVLGELSFGIVPTLDDKGQIIISTSQGTVIPRTVNIKSGIGRVNWRQLD